LIQYRKSVYNEKKFKFIYPLNFDFYDRFFDKIPMTGFYQFYLFKQIPDLIVDILKCVICSFSFGESLVGLMGCTAKPSANLANSNWIKRCRTFY